MSEVKRSVWIGAFNAAVKSAARLIKHPKELRKILEEAAKKMHAHSEAIGEIFSELEIIIRLVKAWVSGEYRNSSTKSILILVGAILYFLNPFDAIPDVIPVVGYVDDVAVLGWVIKTLKTEIDKFRAWEKGKEQEDRS